MVRAGAGAGRKAHAQPQSRAVIPQAAAAAVRLDDQSINVWIDGNDGRPAPPLRVGTKATACFNVGTEVEEGLVAGPKGRIALEDIPPEGLSTEWILSSSTVELSRHSDDPGVIVDAIAAGNETPAHWTARFHVLIPRDGSTPVRRVGVTPLEATAAEFDLVLMNLPRTDVWPRSTPEVYRSISVALPLASRAVGITGGAASKVRTTDVSRTPAAHLGLRPPHEWQTPPEQLTILVSDASAWLVATSSNGNGTTLTVPWRPSIAAVERAIQETQGALDDLRDKHDAYFEAIEPSDLRERLAEFQPHHVWSGPHGVRTPEHEAAWQVVASSDELWRLSQHGHTLFKELFPDGTGLRERIAALVPGARLNVNWLKNSTNNWVSHVPWGLLHPAEPKERRQARDANAFLGIRLRIANVAHAIDNQSKALGPRDTASFAHMLYWGTGPNDVTAREVRSHRNDLQAIKNSRFVPTPAEGQKKELLDFLTRPAPSPVALLYLYCQCAAANGSEPVLRFANSIQAADNVEAIELPLDVLADQPLVFLNTCDSAAAGAFNVNPLEQRFFDRKCRAFIGTECKVPTQIASRFATAFFHFLCLDDGRPPMTAGEAFVQARLFLWDQYRILGGLFYAYINEYDLCLGDAAEVAARRNAHA